MIKVNEIGIIASICALLLLILFMISDIGEIHQRQVFINKLDSELELYGTCKDPDTFRKAIDRWGSPLIYSKTVDNNFITVTIRSAGKDKIAFSEDDIIQTKEILK
jgi:hypothetical protein